MPRPYYHSFFHRRPPTFPLMSARRQLAWQFAAGVAIGCNMLYLHWRWTASLNQDALFFSLLVVTAETLFAIGTALFFFDIWQEGDTMHHPPPNTRDAAGLQDTLPDDSVPDTSAKLKRMTVDIFITAYDEDVDIVSKTIIAAKRVTIPKGFDVQIYLLDDGNRPQMAQRASEQGINYLSRTENTGFKAGNLRNGLFHSDGDFVLICDADTCLFPQFLQNTLGYFRDPQVAWVQTPHWFYDIPTGQPPVKILCKLWPGSPRWLRRILHRLSGNIRVGRDPYMSEPTIFFDVIQRRRNRHAASFCCGAASIHRREAIFEVALTHKLSARKHQQNHLQLTTQQVSCAPRLQPYRFHVSEDLYTSVDLHSAQPNWRSVYHPAVEAKMLSPRSVEAFCTQRLKYAGGSIDLMLRDLPCLRRGMPWQHRLHYAATFYSYLTVLWAPILLIAPAYSLLTATAPVNAYSWVFFLYFIPMLLTHELAMLITSKGYSLTNGRYLAIATLPLQLRAFALVLRGKRPRFPPTPKTEGAGRELHFLRPFLLLALALMAIALFGILQWHRGLPGYGLTFLLINLFWLGWNIAMLLRLPVAAWLHFMCRPQMPTRPHPQLRSIQRHDISQQSL